MWQQFYENEFETCFMVLTVAYCTTHFYPNFHYNKQSQIIVLAYEGCGQYSFIFLIWPNNLNYILLCKNIVAEWSHNYNLLPFVANYTCILNEGPYGMRVCVKGGGVTVQFHLVAMNYWLGNSFFIFSIFNSILWTYTNKTKVIT